MAITMKTTKKPTNQTNKQTKTRYNLNLVVTDKGKIKELEKRQKEYILT